MEIDIKKGKKFIINRRLMFALCWGGFFAIKDGPLNADVPLE